MACPQCLGIVSLFTSTSTTHTRRGLSSSRQVECRHWSRAQGDAQFRLPGVPFSDGSAPHHLDWYRRCDNGALFQSLVWRRLRVLCGAARGQDAKAAPTGEDVLRKRQSIIAISAIATTAISAIATTAATKPGPARRQPRAPYKGTAADSKPSQARHLETETRIPRGSSLGGFLKTDLGIERHLLLVDDDWCGAHDLGLGHEVRGRRVFLLLLLATSTTP